MRTPLTMLTAAILPLLSGCAGWTYDQVTLGRQLRENERMFPEGRSRRTVSGLCFLEHDLAGRTDAIVVLLTRDRRICGKLHATHVRRNLGFKVDTGYVLSGEIDPELANFRATGPIDTLRAIADDLTAGELDNFTREAHAWVAAGLVRLVQRWPHLGDEGPAFPRLSEMLEHIPGGGQARIVVNPAGHYIFDYQHGVAP